MENKNIEPKNIEPKRDNKRFIWLILLILLLLSSLVIGVVLVQRRVFFLPRATEIGEISPENSYVFASPLIAQAGGKEKIRVTVFILDTEGRGVSSRLVSLGRDERLEIVGIREVTDDLGRAIFDISAVSAADYFIEAMVENRILPQRVKVSFR